MIKLVDITKEYQFHFKKLLVLDKINLELQENCFTAIIGKSGSGKTTLLNIISGLLEPTSGQIIYNKNEVKRFFDRRSAQFRSHNIGFVFQQFNLIPYYSVLENVTMPLKFSAVPPKEQIERGLSLLSQLGISEKKDFYPNLLSGGQMQRVAIARALIKNPQIIIADEPTGNLDQKTSHEIFDIFQNLHEKNKTAFLIVSHDPEIINKTKDKYRIENKSVTRIE